mmetsp:Transcript_129738/g.361399  ORF Transcript_129738/g.361399 Transcript_129738/m.361399 type:complete len:387 (-) Transcript_129738:97-1257(-)
MADLATLSVHRATDVGWDERALPNETMDDHGRLLRHTAFAIADPRAPMRRSLDDPGVQQLRALLRERNGIRGLEICGSEEVDRAVRLFRRDGFVVVRNALDVAGLRRLREGVTRRLKELLSEPGTDGRKYLNESGRLPHRYGLGTTSGSRHLAHDPVWAELIDTPVVTPMLTKIFGSKDYLVTGCGGELCLPGAMEYQHLHRDSPDNPAELHEARLEQARQLGLTPKAKLTTSRLIHEFTPPYVAVHFLTSDLTWENGPIRQIPGTHATQQHPPSLEEEPEWMRFSTLVGAPAGAAVIRDGRAWHGATPNVSREVRALPSIEYGPFWTAGWGEKFMPHEVWEALSPHGQHICRNIKADPGIWPKGAGVSHPLASRRGRANLPTAKL